MQIQDLTQRLQAIDPKRSFIVQAPAGSGKTSILIQRILELLALVNDPKEILAITFTKKAAAEMRHRLIETLLKAQTISDEKILQLNDYERENILRAKKVLSRDAEKNWRLIHYPSLLRIQTFDAFCNGIVKQAPLVAGIPVGSDISDNPDELYEKTAINLLRKLDDPKTEISDKQALSDVLLYMDNETSKFKDAIVELLPKRDQWLQLVSEKSELFNSNSRQDLENILKHISKHNAKNFAVFYLDFIKFLTICELDSKISDNIENINTNDCHLIYETLYTQTNSLRKNIEKKVIDLNPDFLTFVQNNFNPKFSKVLPEQFSDDYWQILNQILHVLMLAFIELKQVFFIENQVDFVEIARGALSVLNSANNNSENVDDLVLKLDQKIQHILVDEFQDTSYSQLALIKNLISEWHQNDGKTLFLVGDPMQSIYSFRGAEVGLFARIQQNSDILKNPNIILTNLTLTMNFRSDPNIINWINNTMINIFPEKNITNGAIEYSKSYSGKISQGADSDVYLHIVVPKEDQNKKENQLNDKKTKIVLINSQLENIIEIIQNTKIKYNKNHKIAILLRTRNKAKDLLKVLRDHQISYLANDVETLLDRIVIQELLALTKAIIYPADRISWFAILRARWLGLSLVELHQIAQELTSEQTVLSYLITHKNEKYQAFGDLMQKSISQRYQIDLSRLIKNLWISLGGVANCDDEELANALKYFDFLKDFATNKSIILFDLTSFEKELNQLYAENIILGENPIEIMTIHKSKGLEFDTVILPNLERTAGNDEESLISWTEYIDDEIQEFLIAPKSSHDTNSEDQIINNFIKNIKKSKAKNEDIRLFYVATTRAKSQLYLLGDLKKPLESPDKKSVESSFLSLLEKANLL